MSTTVRSGRRLNQNKNKRCQRCGGSGAGLLAQNIGPYKVGARICGKCLKPYQKTKPVHR